jgi:hypothetical protein
MGKRFAAMMNTSSSTAVPLQGCLIDDARETNPLRQHVERLRSAILDSYSLISTTIPSRRGPQFASRKGIS